MTKSEIIQEAAHYYMDDVNRRAVSPTACMYFYQGKMCAVGRCLADPEDFQNKVGTCSVDNLYYDKDIVLDEHLKEEYKGHDNEFWKELQHFHDNTSNWLHDGLSVRGEVTLNELLDKYKD